MTTLTGRGAPAGAVECERVRSQAGPWGARSWRRENGTGAMAAAMTVCARRVRICFLTTMVPGSRQTGSEVVTHAFAEALRAAGHQTVVVGDRRSGTAQLLHADDTL